MTPSRPPFPDSSERVPPNLQRVLGRSPSTMTLGLANIRRLLERLGNPQEHLKTAVVAGTNGKGSVTAMLAAILSESGMRVGRFTSPHVYAVNERIAVDGVSVRTDELERAACDVAAIDVEYSYFEGLMAIACLVFQRRGVDFAVFETGLGGRFDATNVTHPAATVITSVAIDHRRLLGDTPREILLEKYGIARAGTPLFVGPLDDALEGELELRARRDGVPVHFALRTGGVGVEGAPPGETRVSIHTPRARYGPVRLPFPGEHQANNALLAVLAAESICDVAVPASALEAAVLPARFESFPVNDRRVILDVAHNDAALCATLRHLRAIAPREKTTVVLGLMRRKELFDAPRALIESAARVVLVEAGAGNDASALTGAELHARYFHRRLTEHGADVMLWNQTSESGWRRLLDLVVSVTPVGGVVLAAGSHHVAERMGRALCSAREPSEAAGAVSS